MYTLTSDGKIVPPVLRESGVGQWLGAATASAAVTRYGGTMGPYSQEMARSAASEAGRRTGGALESAALNAFYANERIYADTYNHQRGLGESHASAKAWADMMTKDN